MRRNLIIGVLLCAVAAGLFLCARWVLRKRTAPEATVSGATTSVASSAPPRMALPSAPRIAGQQVTTTQVDESDLMRQLRVLVKNQSPRAEALAREARQHFADSADSDERDALLVYALVNQRQIGAARDEGYYYYAHHPEGRFVRQVFTMTGVHPPPKKR